MGTAPKSKCGHSLGKQMSYLTPDAQEDNGRPRLNTLPNGEDELRYLRRNAAE